MQSFIPTLKPQTLKSWRIITPILALLLVLAVACGEAAAPTSPPPAAQATEAPQTAAQATEAPQAATQPTAVPEAMAEPEEAMVEVNPGKLTIMVAALAPERFSEHVIGGGTPGLNYMRLIGGFLVSDNERKEMVPGIASKWGFSPDGLTWTFTIRDGVKFHDGTELTAEDVLWTLQHYYGPGVPEYTNSHAARLLSGLTESIELSEPDKVIVKHNVPVLDFDVRQSETSTSSYHMLPKRAKLLDREDDLAYDLNPIAAGPLRLVKHVSGSVMSFERFEDFYFHPKNGLPEDKRMNFQSLDLFLVPEEATRVAAIRAGEADIAPVSIAARKQVEAGGGRLVFSQEGGFPQIIVVGWWANPDLSTYDRRVRHALDYAINKELIQDRLYEGPEVFQVKGWASTTPSSIGYTPQLDPRPFDPDKARQLLADAGYPGGQGFGKLVVNVSPSGVLPLLVEMTQLMAENWERELGLDVEVRTGDRTAFRERMRAGDFDGQIFVRDQETRIDPSSSMISGYASPKRRDRAHNYPEVVSRVQETYRILDPDKRLEAILKLVPELRDIGYHLGVGYFNIPWAVGPRAVTWEPYPLSPWPSALHTVTLQ